MNHKLLFGAIMVSLAVQTRAALYDYNFDGATHVSLGIPDGNPTGVSSLLNVAIPDANSSLGDVNVYLNISGGFNGDLYGYLVSPTGTRVDLINRIGTDGSHPLGNTSSGINVILDAGAAFNIQDVTSGTVSGTYQPTGNLNTFSLGSPSANGNWILFLSDMSGGDSSTSTLVSWGLELETVPEPTTWALIAFGIIFLIKLLLDLRWGRLKT